MVVVVVVVALSPPAAPPPPPPPLPTRHALQTRQANIEDDDNNYTRFILLSRVRGEVSRGGRPRPPPNTAQRLAATAHDQHHEARRPTPAHHHAGPSLPCPSHRSCVPSRLKTPPAHPTRPTHHPTRPTHHPRCALQPYTPNPTHTHHPRCPTATSSLPRRPLKPRWSSSSTTHRAHSTARSRASLSATSTSPSARVGPLPSR